MDFLIPPESKPFTNMSRSLYVLYQASHFGCYTFGPHLYTVMHGCTKNNPDTSGDYCTTQGLKMQQIRREHGAYSTMVLSTLDDTVCRNIIVLRCEWSIPFCTVPSDHCMYAQGRLQSRCILVL